MFLVENIERCWCSDVFQKRNDRTKPLKRSRYESSSRQENRDLGLNSSSLFYFTFRITFTFLIETFRNDQSGCLCFASKARKGSAGWKWKCETMRWLKMKPHNVKQYAGWRKAQIDTNCSQLKCTTTATIWNSHCTVCNILSESTKISSVKMHSIWIHCLHYISAVPCIIRITAKLQKNTLTEYQATNKREHTM